jgi:hypothetical protein
MPLETKIIPTSNTVFQKKEIFYEDVEVEEQKKEALRSTTVVVAGKEYSASRESIEKMSIIMTAAHFKFTQRIATKGDNISQAWTKIYENQTLNWRDINGIKNEITVEQLGDILSAAVIKLKNTYL